MPCRSFLLLNWTKVATGKTKTPGRSTVSNPHFLNLGIRLVDFVVKGDVNRKELMPNLIT
jgi:hypothetical protein